MYPITRRRLRRLQQAWTLAQFAPRVGISTTYLGQLERGLKRSPKYEARIDALLARAEGRKLRAAEQAVDRPFSRKASLRLDRAVIGADR